MAAVALKPAAPTLREVISVTVFLAITAMESLALVSRG